MAARGDLVAQFIEITGTDENTARFYLSSCDWDIEQALGNYWSTQSDLPAAPATVVGQPGNPTPPSVTTSTAPAAGAAAVAAAVTVAATTVTPTASAATTSTATTATATVTKAAPVPSTAPSKGSTSKPKFATLSDMSKTSSSDDEHQAFYAGGSDRSGQQVLGPAKRKNFREQLTDMMRSAQEQNIAEVGVGPSTSAANAGGSVWGQGMRLGMTDSDHTAVGTNRGTQPSENKPVVVLKLWSQGFSIDGGELRHYDDPQNKEFLETVMRGEIPQELLEMGRMVNVDVEDHRMEDFKRQSAPQTFKGSGQKLGSPVANIVTNKPPAAADDAVVTPGEAANQEASARDAINLNAEAPSTTLQIRLADGSRLAAQFNLTHTVSDIRRFIQNARPQYSNSNFVLVSSFPTRELSDDSSTIEKAGLKNAALMQRLK